LWHLFNGKLNLFTLTRVYSTISPSRVSPSPHCYTPPQTEAFFSNLMHRLQDHLWVYPRHAPLPLLQGLSFVPTPWTIAYYPKDPCLCLHHSTILHTNILWFHLFARLTPWGIFWWHHNIACWDTTQPKSLSLWVWVQLCYINHPY
jgi:hypothetical protein